MPVIRLNINDDEEITSCEYCRRHVQPYNNTSLSTTPSHNLYTKTLLEYHHLNCQKCGLYIEFHPKNPADESLIFLCPNYIPHKHCLCYDCGLLYNLKTHKKPTDIISQLQYHNSNPSSHTQIQTQHTDPSNSVLTSNTNFPSSMETVSNGTFIAELMNEMANAASTTDNNPAHDDSSNVSSDGLSFLLGTVLAFFVWFGIYLTSPELFRLSGCFIWFSIFYFLINVFFTENESVQKAVFSLFGFSPIFAAIFILQKTKQLSNGEILPDLQKTIQFFCIFGMMVYLSYCFSPLEMYLFLTNDFMELTFTQQIASVFIAVSLGSFLVILCKNCNFLNNVWTETDYSQGKYLELDQSYHENISMTDLKTAREITEVDKQIVKKKNKRKRRRRKKKILRAD